MTVSVRDVDVATFGEIGLAAWQSKCYQQHCVRDYKILPHSGSSMTRKYTLAWLCLFVELSKRGKGFTRKEIRWERHRAGAHFQH